jgi:hypothetical protein
MDTSSIIGKDGTPVIVNSPNRNGYDQNMYQNDWGHGLYDLLNANNIADNSRAVLNAIQFGTAQAVEATHRVGVAGIKETSDASRDNLRETARVGTELSHDISESRAAIERTSAEGRLATAISSGEIRELVREATTTNLLAIKDTDKDVLKESCETRQLLQSVATTNLLQIKDIQRDVFAEACKTREESFKQFAQLQKDIAECCCENKLLVKDTQALIIAQTSDRKNDELAELRLKLAILSNGKQ